MQNAGCYAVMEWKTCLLFHLIGLKILLFMTGGYAIRRNGASARYPFSEPYRISSENLKKKLLRPLSG